MKQIKRYKVVVGHSLRELEEEVEKAIWKGYVPQGGVLLYAVDGKRGSNKGETLAQAMYMSEDEYDYRMESVEKISNLVTGTVGTSGD
ncbi:MAG: hypothetical protein ABJK20_16675 [Halieaceae bacterium]